jgi:hypothetical protein
MDCLRKTAPLLSLLLMLIVGGEMTDMLPCADIECGAWSTLLHPDAPPPDSGTHGDGESSAECLCHAVFVSTAVRTAVPAPAPEDGAMLNADPARSGLQIEGVPYPPPRA